MRARGHIHIAPLAPGMAAGAGERWSGTMRASDVVTDMGGLLGNQKVLQRTPNGLVAWLVNPAGNTTPYIQPWR